MSTAEEDRDDDDAKPDESLLSDEFLFGNLYKNFMTVTSLLSSVIRSVQQIINVTLTRRSSVCKVVQLFGASLSYLRRFNCILLGVFLYFLDAFCNQLRILCVITIYLLIRTCTSGVNW